MRVNTLRPATLYFMYSLHSVCRTLEWKTALRNVCSGGCLSQLLDLFFRTIRWQSVFLLPRERERLRPPGRTLSACHPAQSRVDLGNETITLQLHFYTLHPNIYKSTLHLAILCSEKIVSCKRPTRKELLNTPDKTCIQISSTDQTDRKNLFPKGSQINE